MAEGVGTKLGFGNCQLSKDREGYIIITGVSRSGTGYITAIFRQMGLDVRHEKYGRDGISSFHIAPYLQFHHKATLLFQTREPLQTISSIQTLRPRTWNGIQHFIPYYSKGNLTKRCMQFWYYWSIMIDGLPVYRYQVEEIGQYWDEICHIINIPNVELPDVPTDTNTREHTQLEWPDLRAADVELYDKIRALSEQFGY